ncbi:MAG: hypothetical protein CL607_02125 [Anaerolineaceae bacterium]|nr:hypothetical protein [Anaerolineaceae bacterium]
MQPVLKMNSEEWWNDYFREHWDQNNGPQQTHHFMLRLLEQLAAPEVYLLNRAGTTVLDWGCAYGQGTDLIARAFKEADVHGLDFAQEATETASEWYPSLDFICSDHIPRKFDVIFVSNCLEHFDEPLQWMRDHIEQCEKVYIAMVPYKERPLIDQHMSQFREESFPDEVNGFSKLYTSVVRTDSKFWHGEQIVAVYGSPSYIEEREQFPPVDIQIDRTHLLINLFQEERATILADRDQAKQQYASLQHAQASLQDKVEALTTLKNRHSDQIRQLQVQIKQYEDLSAKFEEACEARDWLKKELMLAERREADTSRKLKQVTQSNIWRWSAPYRRLRNILQRRGRQKAAVASLPEVTERAALPGRPAEYKPMTAALPKGKSRTSEKRLEPPKKLSEIEKTLHTIVGEPQTTYTSYDIIIYSIIELEARFQRPQQMAAHLAAAGLRVFYISSAKFLPASDNRPYALRKMAPNLYEIVLRATKQPAIYNELISPALEDEFSDHLQVLFEQNAIHTALQIVELPFWVGLSFRTRDDYGWRVIYDCMDEWEDFPGIQPALLDGEKQLLKDSDLVTMTAQVLYDKYAEQTREALLLRNAVAFDLFAEHVVPNDIASDYEHPIIGYYGALAEWVDYDLLMYVAKQRPEWTFIMLGDIFVDVDDLKALPNVHLLGRKPHEEMPLYLYHFDVCLIPFKINKITDAVDPVKMYEYLSAGKPVVAARILELRHYEDVLYLADTHEQFLEQIDKALAEVDPALAQQRIELAKANDWHHRVEQLQAAVEAFYPSFSIVIVTWKNLDLTQQCVESILRNTDYPNYEIIIVDNASDDGTPDYLRSLADNEERVTVILNDENRGFAAANNQGIKVATGANVVLLNNDTIVTRGWLTGLGRYLKDEKIGMVGPVTNFVGNAARIDVPYKTVEEMEVFANEWMHAHRGDTFEIDMLAMYCVAMRHSLIDEVGLLDESYGIGMFEDDDYAERTRAAGYDIVCTRDVFIHHHGQASFKLLPQDEYQQLWEANQSYYEGKFDKPWLQSRSSKKS